MFHNNIYVIITQDMINFFNYLLYLFSGAIIACSKTTRIIA